jgi:aspartate aminotransferase
MTELLSNRINALEESQTLAMTKKARELAAQGMKVINLSIGEPDFPTPAHIKEAAKKAIDDDYSFYTPVAGFADLRAAIAEKLKRDNNLDWKAENIVVSTGAKQSLANALLCLLNPGDEVVIYSPYWVSYSELVKLAEGTPVLIQGTLENNFKAKIDQLKAAITPRTKVIMFSSPSNPTGGAFTEAELREIAEVVAQNPGVFVLADEIYEYINFTGAHFSIGSIPEVKDQVITINGFSKGFAMTGWRLGYTASVKWLADAMDKLQGQVTSGANSIAQRAALAGVKADLSATEEMAKTYLRRRDLVVKMVNDIPGFKCPTPDGAFYVFPDVSAYLGKTTPAGGKISTVTDLCMFLLADAGVSLVTGEAFGEPNCLRLSYAASDENLIEALTKVKESCAKLS